MIQQAIGCTYLFIAIVIAVIMFIQLMTGPKTKDVEEFPVASMMDQSVPTTKWVENWRVLIIITVFLLLIADRKSTRLNSSHVSISYAVFCLKKKKKKKNLMPYSPDITSL